MIKQGGAKLVIFANNYAALRQPEIEYYAMLAKTSVCHNKGNRLYWAQREENNTQSTY